MVPKQQHFLLPIIIVSGCLSARSSAPPGQRNGSTSGAVTEVAQQLSPLEHGTTIEREIATGQSHTYAIAAASDRFLKIVVDQRGASLELKLRGPNGELVASFFPYIRCVETLYVICRDAGQYKLDVTFPDDGMNESGRYRLTISELRTIRPNEDASLLLAQQKYMEGHELAESRNSRNRGTGPAEKYEEAYRLFEVAGDRIGAANALCAKAALYTRAGNDELAIAAYGRVVPLWKDQGEPRSAVLVLSKIGSINTGQGKYAEALRNFQDALDLLREGKDARSEADLRESIALAWEGLGGWQQALDSLENALRLYNALSDGTEKAKVLARIGTIYKDSIPNGERQAANYFQQAIKELGAGDKLFARDVLDRLEETKRIIAAIDAIDRAHQVYVARMGQAQHLLVARTIRSLEDLNIDAPVPALYATVLNTIGLGYEIIGDKAEALRSYVLALRQCDELGDPEGAEHRRFAIDHITKLNPSYNDPFGWIKGSQPELMFQAGHSSEVDSLVISPDGNLIASSGRDGMVKLWDTHSDRLVRTLNKEPGRFMTRTKLAFSPNGKLLVAQSYNFGHAGSGRVWLVARGRTLFALSRGYNLAFSPDGHLLVVYPEPRRERQDTTVTLWDSESGAMIGSLPGHLGGVGRVGFSRDGKLLACDCLDGIVRVWQIDHGNQFKSLALESHGQNANLDVQWGSGLRSDSTTADGTLSVEAKDRDIRLLDKATNKLIRVYKGAPYEKTGVDWHEKVDEDPRPYSPEVSLGLDRGTLSWSDNTSIRIWDSQTGTLVRSYAPPDSESIKLSPDGNIALVGSWDGVRVLQARSGKVIHFFEDMRLSWDQSLSKDGRLLITGHGEIIDTYTGRRLRDAEGSFCEFSEDGKIMTLLDDEFGPDKTKCALYQRDFRTGKRVFGPKRIKVGGGTTFEIHLSPDRRRLAVFQGGNQMGDYELFDTNTGESLGELSGGGIGSTPLVFSPDNRTIAVVDDGPPIDLWDAESGQLLNTLAGHSDDTTALRFALGGKILISASIDGSIRFWATETGELLATLLVLKGDDWLITTPDGLFDGRADAMRMVNWRDGNTDEVVPLDAFYNDFYYPGLLAEILEGKRPKAAIDIATALQLPGLRIMLAQRMASIEKRDSKTFLCFRDKPTVVPNVLVDAQPLAFDVHDLTFEEEDPVCRYRKELSGSKQYEMINASSLPRYKTLKLSYDGSKSETLRSTLHVQTVGISSYDYGRSGFKPLLSSASGAREVEQFFTEQQNNTNKPYRDIRVWKGLYDQEATRDGISQRLAQMAKEVKEDDVIFLFFSGHGIVPAGQEMFYFAPIDMRGPNPQDQRESGLNTAMIAEAIREIPARRVVLIIDACQSGGALESLAKIAEVKAKVEQRRAKIGRKKGTQGKHEHEVGVYLIAAATPLQEAVQPKVGNGALVKTLLEELKSEGHGSRRDVWIRDVAKRIERRLPEVSAQIGERHTPMTVSSGLDFRIAGNHLGLVRKNQRKVTVPGQRALEHHLPRE